MYFTIICTISLQKQEPTFSESSEEMDSTENVNDKESDDEIEETDESDEDMADDQNDPDWSLMEENGHENPCDDDKEKDDEANPYIRCGWYQGFLGTKVGGKKC